MERVLRVSEAAERIRIAPEVLRRLERRGFFKAARDYRGRLVFTPEDVERIKKKIFPNGFEAEI